MNRQLPPVNLNAALRRQVHKFSQCESSCSYSELSGMDNTISLLRTAVSHPLLNAAYYAVLRVSPPRGVLLYGPTGCGKTTLAKAAANELKVPLFYVSATELISSVGGETEKNIQSLFSDAEARSPSIVCIDHMEAIALPRERAETEMQRRRVTQLITSIDSLTKPVVVMGITDDADSIDVALRSNGRFEKEIRVPLPNEEGRRAILEKMCMDVPRTEIDFVKIAQETPGYAPGDLRMVHLEAVQLAITRACSLQQGPEKVFLTEEDYRRALNTVVASSMRENRTRASIVTWNDVGALERQKHELVRYIVDYSLNVERYKRFGVSRPAGILLWGPPGCGKTMLVKAVAYESSCNFLCIRGSELFNKYVGDSEKYLSKTFARARSLAPCIVFFDEIDTLSNRSSDDNGIGPRLINQLLAELDGLEERGEVFVLAATNRPDCVDPALLRPGRFDKTLFVGMPTMNERMKILAAIASKAVHGRIEWERLPLNRQHTGADLELVVREAGLMAIERNEESITEELICKALSLVPESVKNYEWYLKLKETYD